MHIIPPRTQSKSQSQSRLTMSHPPTDRQRRRPLAGLGTTGGAAALATAGLAAYGTYRLLHYAWGSHFQDFDASGSDGDRSPADAAATAEAKSTPRRAGSSPEARERAASSRRRTARRSRLRRCRGEVRAALGDFLPTLRDVVEGTTDFAADTTELKEIREARVERRRRQAARRGNDLLGGGDGDEIFFDVANGDDGAAADAHAGAHAGATKEREERRREAELWEAIKVKSITRLLAIAYGHSILLLVLTAQVHLLGGRLFREELDIEGGGGTEDRHIDVPRAGGRSGADGFSATSSLGLLSRTDPSQQSARGASVAYQSTHREVLTRTYGKLFSDGIPALVRTVRAAVAEAFATIDVTNPDTMHVTRAQFDRSIDAVRSAVEGDINRGGGVDDTFLRHQGKLRGRHRHRRSALNHFVIRDIPNDEGWRHGRAPHHGVEADNVALHILDETWDVMESPTYEAAEADVLNLTFAMMRDGGWGGIFPVTISDIIAPNMVSQEQDQELPLASVIAQVRKTASTFCSCFATIGGDLDGGGVEAAVPPNAYVPVLERSRILAELGDASFS